MQDAFHYGTYALTSASVFLSFLVFIIYSRNNFNRALLYKGISILLFTLSFRFFTIHLYLNQLIADYPHFLLLNNLTSRIGLPILYFVVLSSLYSWKFKWFDLFHLVLPVLFIVHFSSIIFGPISQKLVLIEEMEKLGYEIVWQKGIFTSPYLINAIKYLTLYGYTFLIISLLIWSRNYKRLPGHLLTFFKLALVFLVVNLIPSLISHLGLDIWNYASLIGAASTLLLTISVFLVPDFLFPSDQISNPLQAFHVVGKTISQTAICSISPKENQLFKKIEAYFESEKPFLDQDFSLSHAERHLGISGRYISEAIKQEAGMNFSAYVNQARLSYFNVYLSKDERMKGKTVDEIANELGFRSVNSFYQYIKKTKGCTPKEYLKSDVENPVLDLLS